MVGASLQTTLILGRFLGKLVSVEVHLNGNYIPYFVVGSWIQGLEPLLSFAAIYNTDT